MNYKLVSIIIPLYNCKPYLQNTLESVSTQSYPNLEIILVDDHSTDGSFDFAKTFEADNLKVVRNIGKGACAARNYGFELSSGEYIQFLDADDLLSQNKIKTQVDKLESFNENSIASGVWGKFDQTIDKVEWGNKNMNKDYNPAYLWLLDSWMGKGTGQTAIWLTSRKLIEKAGLWNEDLKINQDGEFFSRILMNTNNIIFCNDAKVYYRFGNPNSISQKHKFSRDKAESLLLSYQLYKKHSETYDLNTQLKYGLGQNFLMFIYSYHGKFKDLIEIAEKDFFSLGFKKMWPVGGERFKKLALLIGFKTALKFREYFGK